MSDTPQIIDGPPPAGVVPVGTIIDGPPPTGVSAVADSTWRQLPGAGFPTRQVALPDGKVTEERPDGSRYFGPDQGNTGLPGWFNAKGERMGLSNGESKPGFWSSIGPGIVKSGYASLQSGDQMGVGDPLSQASLAATTPYGAGGQATPNVSGEIQQRIDAIKGFMRGRPVERPVTKVRVETISGFKDVGERIAASVSVPCELIDHVPNKMVTLDKKSAVFENKRVFLNQNISPALKTEIAYQLTTNVPKNDDLRDAIFLGIDEVAQDWSTWV